MPDEPEPPRKTYGFKEREFQRDNAPSSEAPPMPTAKDLAKLAGVHHDPAPRQAGPKAGDPNDVYATLQRNRAHEQAHGLDRMEIRRIRRRKLRDYLLIMVPAQLLLGSITVLGRGNPVVFVSGLAGMALVFITITWIMWQLMDRY